MADLNLSFTWFWREKNTANRFYCISHHNTPTASGSVSTSFLPPQLNAAQQLLAGIILQQYACALKHLGKCLSPCCFSLSSVDFKVLTHLHCMPTPPGIRGYMTSFQVTSRGSCEIMSHGNCQPRSENIHLLFTGSQCQMLSEEMRKHCTVKYQFHLLQTCPFPPMWVCSWLKTSFWEGVSPMQLFHNLTWLWMLSLFP